MVIGPSLRACSSPSRYRWISAVALGLLMVIVVTGAAVRLTGSGLGCDDWPNCNDERLIDVSSGHAAIEQVNRLFTGLVAVAVIAAVLGSLWRRPRRRDLTGCRSASSPACSARSCSAGSPCSSTSTRSPCRATCCCRWSSSPPPSCSSTGPASPTGVPDAAAVATTAPGWLGARRRHRRRLVTGTVVTGAGPHAGDEDVERFGVAISHGRARPRHHA